MIDALSKSNTGRDWLKNFEAADRAAARALLDSLQLINLDEVSELIYDQLETLALERSGKRKSVALYVEREFQEKLIFSVEHVKKTDGNVRERAIGNKGPLPVKPIRGGVRVGSEGTVSSLIGQAVKKHSGIFVNTPGPDRFRSKRNPISTITLVTDFIGSGSRLLSMLDKFWNVKTVRSWHSTGLIDFVVIAASATEEGAAAVGNHITRPNVRFGRSIPTMYSSVFEKHYLDWDKLLEKMSSEGSDDAYMRGYLDSAAMVLFSYGIPNNAPSILWKSTKDTQPLYLGNAPAELRGLFWSGSRNDQVKRAALERGHKLDPTVDVKEQIILLVLQEISGQFSKNKVRELSQRLSLPNSDILEALGVASLRKLIESNGRLTEKGYEELRAQNIDRERKIIVPTNAEPYYPMRLRASKGTSSTNRSKERS